MTDHTQSLLAEVLIAPCDTAPAAAPSGDLIDPRDLPPGCLAVEDPPSACPYLARLESVYCYLYNADDGDLDGWWLPCPFIPTDLPQVRIIATGLVARADVREAILRHEQGRTI